MKQPLATLDEKLQRRSLRQEIEKLVLALDHFVLRCPSSLNPKISESMVKNIAHLTSELIVLHNSLEYNKET